MFLVSMLQEEIQHDSPLRLNKVNTAPSVTQPPTPRCTVTMLHDICQDLEYNKTAEEFEDSWYYFCGTDPLADLRLVPLRQDVDVRLKRAGLDHGFVSVAHKQRLTDSSC